MSGQLTDDAKLALRDYILKYVGVSLAFLLSANAIAFFVLVRYGIGSIVQYETKGIVEEKITVAAAESIALLEMRSKEFDERSGDIKGIMKLCLSHKDDIISTKSRVQSVAENVSNVGNQVDRDAAQVQSLLRDAEGTVLLAGIDEGTAKIVDVISKDVVAKATEELAIRNSDVPVGTVVAYSGPLGSLDTAVERGWMLCDGTQVPAHKVTELYELFNGGRSPSDGEIIELPDYQGYFLRGADGRVPEDITGVDPDRPRDAGDTQQFSTAMPSEVPFKTKSSGKHSHSVSGTSGNGTGHVSFPGSGDQGENTKRSTSNDGTHTHDIVGGDVETRPTNVAVHWLIKVRS